MSHCAVTADLNRYLKTLDLSEAKEEAIEEESEKLMEKGQDYYPFTVCNLAEAIGEISATDLDRISQFFDQGNIAMAGGALFYAVKNYWQQLADKKAEENIESSWHERNQPDPDDYREDSRDF